MRAASAKRLPTAVQCGCYRLRALCWTLLGALAGPTAAPAAPADGADGPSGRSATGTTGEERR
ncbi:hypothetical protein ACIQBJ_02480 [Kitasatospora sp. NPDC088391]|uniref:hypothetical protein n=1 Tax=Kitasatospora sp. NPDC088391 TaxID=3364074 RepID=UPI0038161492